ncbi:trypsin [Dictyocaulus viviparus]|uniref:Trypsin n=1 Tax=Dictyocaulus viviparus TaxID=29172 RepID=A0A0D8XRV2_DICVI|nr:trypsin [Dictyocaulus viviparus]
MDVLEFIVIVFLLIIEQSFAENEATSSGRLSREESNELKKTCGRTHFSRTIEKRSVGGRKAEKNEFPWTVAVLGESICSGALISDRHVLTSAHCGIKRIHRVRCEEMALEDTYEKLEEELIVLSGMEEGCSVDTKEGCTLFKAIDMIVHPKHNPCNGDYDVALLEITPSMTPDKGSPICMPKEYEEVPTGENRMTAAGFGVNPEHPNERYLDALNLTMDGIEREHARIVTKSYGRSICKGDSGGPLSKLKRSGQNVLLGITMGYHDCVQDSEEHLSFFVDARLCVPWVWVCPKTKSDD